MARKKNQAPSGSIIWKTAKTEEAAPQPEPAAEPVILDSLDSKPKKEKKVAAPAEEKAVEAPVAEEPAEETPAEEAAPAEDDQASF